MAQSGYEIFRARTGQHLALPEHMEVEKKNYEKGRATKEVVPKSVFIFLSNPWLNPRTKAKTETESHTQKCLKAHIHKFRLIHEKLNWPLK